MRRATRPDPARPTRPRSRAPRALALAVSAVLALGAASCGAGDGDGDGEGAADTGAGDRPTVVVTTSILGDVTRNVVGDEAEVQVLLPPGADPHDVEPSARQVAELRDADLVVANGLGLEAGLADALAAAADDGVPVLEVAPQLSPIPFRDRGGAADDHTEDDEQDEHADDGTGHAEDEGHDDDHGDLDPHVWMDPDRMAAAGHMIADALAEAAPVDRAVLEAGAQAHDDELRALDETIQATLADVPPERRVLVTNHESLGYFAERYGFEVVGTVIPGGSTLAEPSAAGIAALADTIRDAGVPAVFTENVDGTELADALVAEVGGEVVVVPLYTDALGEPGSGAETYVGLMTVNAERIAGALRP